MSDAVTMLGDLSAFVDAGTDTINEAQLAERITQLATEKSYLLAADTPPPPAPTFTPNRGQGQSGNAPLTPSQTAAHAESQQDWKAHGAANAQQLINLTPS
ncbi:hypothetical protein B1R94_25995 [Mycolicibacterium litorale]|nr:hypothetical protein B1R94_25995 [Mycolicibacterium litorale]